MEKYLIDTNAFWEILCEIAGIPAKGKRFDIEEIKKGECYISEITKVEIMSVMGKYARGEQAQWQMCNRFIGEDGTRCTARYFNPGRKKWKSKQTAAMRKLVKDILEGNSGVFQVRILPVTETVIREAERFINYAFKYKFASLDAVIAGTACCYDKQHFNVVTHDTSLRKALKDDGIHIVDELETVEIGNRQEL